jgi:hypothetical protein
MLSFQLHQSNWAQLYWISCGIRTGSELYCEISVDSLKTGVYTMDMLLTALSH